MSESIARFTKIKTQLIMNQVDLTTYSSQHLESPMKRQNQLIGY